MVTDHWSGRLWIGLIPTKRRSSLMFVGLQRSEAMEETGFFCPTYDFHPHIGGHHPVLYFIIQVTEKFSNINVLGHTCLGHTSQQTDDFARFSLVLTQNKLFANNKIQYTSVNCENSAFNTSLRSQIPKKYLSAPKQLL